MKHRDLGVGPLIVRMGVTVVVPPPADLVTRRLDRTNARLAW